MKDYSGGVLTNESFGNAYIRLGSFAGRNDSIHTLPANLPGDRA